MSLNFVSKANLNWLENISNTVDYLYCDSNYRRSPCLYSRACLNEANSHVYKKIQTVLSGENAAMERKHSNSSISVVVATLNEEKGISPTLEELRKVLNDPYLHVVDGNSADKLASWLRNLEENSSSEFTYLISI